MTIYYKAFSRDMKCRDFQFREGETYEFDGKPVLCKQGFHFCKNLVLTLAYYHVVNSITENRYAEVEVLGDTEFEKPTGHKGVTNKIRIVRVLPDDEVLAMVDNNNNSGYDNSGHRNSGYGNSGNSNSGIGNSGYRNSGYRNSGDGNSGHRNSGHDNSGDDNSGDGNSGDDNSGDGNSGYYNSGHGNSGNRNSGSWNSSDSNSGFFNSVELETILVFNKLCSITSWNEAKKPAFLFFQIDPELGYKKSFQKSYENTSEEDRALLLELPNFDADVFYNISGIRVK